MMALGWGSLFVFLACMVALGLGSRDLFVVILSTLMALLCCWAALTADTLHPPIGTKGTS